jgi:hypothetical protein
MNKQRIALILSLFALGVAGCGGDDDDESATTIPTVPLSVPGDETSTLGDDSDTTVDTVPDTATPAPTPTPAPAPTPTPTPVTPDSPDNDTPPPAGSEAEQFEDFCTENPGAC